MDDVTGRVPCGGGRRLLDHFLSTRRPGITVIPKARSLESTQSSNGQ
jgi:hypothetical protein